MMQKLVETVLYVENRGETLDRAVLMLGVMSLVIAVTGTITIYS
ncbi:hypothetical protein LCGC14_2041930 [marine sediment metagenome]|uniref:Uncharacterized protein n=1 Tax=marine sediment metagenome TaxID=412755 RepID=A0A0F9ERG2_9ZZZZ